MKSRLLSRKSASRESMDFISASARRSAQRWMSRPMEVIKVTPMKIKNDGPMALCAKACTEDSTPERVRKVPKMTSA